MISDSPRLKLAHPPSRAGPGEQMDLTTPGMASEFPGYSERYVLIDPPPPPSRFERAVGTIFRPEVIRYRNVNFSCTLVTAIKRRNPFCLLNPVVIHISW